jgi:dTDP-4-dehydrorhamnose reductase
MDYKNKYLKYKNKYLKYKNFISQNGGSDEVSALGNTQLMNTIEQKISKLPPSTTPLKIIFLSGGSGTIGTAFLDLLKDNKSYFIIYPSRNCNSRKISSNNILCINFDLYEQPRQIQFAMLIKTLIEKLTNYIFYIINAAADKDSNLVKKTFNISHPNITTISIEELTQHWSYKFSVKLAEVAKEKNIPLIHISTVYVNKGDPTSSDNTKYTQQITHTIRKWNTQLVDIGATTTFDITKSNYIYGALKALTEKAVFTKYPKSIIIRLPVIIDENHITSLEDTSPTKVIYDFILSSKNTGVDNIQKRYPITSQYVATFLLKCIENFELHKTIPNPITALIINLPGYKKITKFDIANHFKDLLTLFREIKQNNDKQTQSNDVPHTEAMTFKSNIEFPGVLKKFTIEQFKKPLESIQKSIEQFFKKTLANFQTLANIKNIPKITELTRIKEELKKELTKTSI